MSKKRHTRTAPSNIDWSNSINKLLAAEEARNGEIVSAISWKMNIEDDSLKLICAADHRDCRLSMKTHLPLCPSTQTWVDFLWKEMNSSINFFPGKPKRKMKKISILLIDLHLRYTQKSPTRDIFGIWNWNLIECTRSSFFFLCALKFCMWKSLVSIYFQTNLLNIFLLSRFGVCARQKRGLIWYRYYGDMTLTMPFQFTQASKQYKKLR